MTKEEMHREEVLRKVRDEFHRRAMNSQTGFRKGDGGLKGLAQRFASMDDDNNKKISKNEFEKGIQELNLPIQISGEDFDALWDALDADGSGFASFDEVVELLGQAMTPTRRHAVRSLFRLLDRTGDGTIQMDDIKLRYLDDARNGLEPMDVPSDEDIFA